MSDHWIPTPGCNCTDCMIARPYYIGPGAIVPEQVFLTLERKLKMNNQTMTRRFYKSHSAIQRPQILRLYSEAVAEAEAEINKGTKAEYYIVEVRAVVRKRQPEVQPIEVIEVK